MTLFPIGKTKSDTTERDSIADLVRKLEDGWQIQSPVYLMSSPVDRSQRVYRMMLLRDERPLVVTLCDGDETRRFIAQQQLKEEIL